LGACGVPNTARQNVVCLPRRRTSSRASAAKCPITAAESAWLWTSHTTCSCAPCCWPWLRCDIRNAASEVLYLLVTHGMANMLCLCELVCAAASQQRFYLLASCGACIVMARHSPCLSCCTAAAGFAALWHQQRASTGPAAAQQQRHCCTHPCQPLLARVGAAAAGAWAVGQELHGTRLSVQLAATQRTLGRGNTRGNTSAPWEARETQVCRTWLLQTAHNGLGISNGGVRCLQHWQWTVPLTMAEVRLSSWPCAQPQIAPHIVRHFLFLQHSSVGQLEWIVVCKLMSAPTWILVLVTSEPANQRQSNIQTASVTYQLGQSQSNLTCMHVHVCMYEKRTSTPDSNISVACKAVCHTWTVSCWSDVTVLASLCAGKP
jgi:hypothetical protein